MCKKLKYDHTIKWFMHNPESVLKYETHNLLRDFEIQTSHLISARQPDQVIINQKKKKKTKKKENFAVPADLRVKLKESEKKDKYMNLDREFLKNVEHKSDVISAFGTVTKDW